MFSESAKLPLYILLCSISIVCADVGVEGVVVNSETNEPVIGANVLVVGTDFGASTDANGYFRVESRIDLPFTLRISHIAYLSRDVGVAMITPLKIRLVPKVLRGEEITVTGERTRAQTEASTAIDVVDIETIELQGARDVGSALRRISSLTIDESSTGSQTVSIRGSNPNEVAVYLDGVKINSTNSGIADLSHLDLNSIRRIEVLRGGNTYLFGQGNLGGVVNLESRGALKNSLILNMGKGLSFDDDQDLSFSGTGVLGPVGVGGRFSGRTRLYEGRTMTSSAFNNIFGDGHFSMGKISVRWYQLRNALTYPSGGVALGDGQTITSIRYQGDVWRSTSWEFFVGEKKWEETNNFFDNLDQTLKERNLSYRVAKEFRTRFLDAIVQLDGESETFDGERTTILSGGNIIADSRGVLSRQRNAVAMVVRWFSEGNTPLLRRLQVELSGRTDDIVTTRSSHLETSDLLLSTTDVTDSKDRNPQTIFNRRVGCRIEGVTNKFGYRLFFSQGNNRRLPTLNDLFLKANTSLDSLKTLPFESEFLNSTEINLQFSFTEFLTTPFISEVALEWAYFRNNYDNKIGYMELKELVEVEEPPFPYNEPKADIRGIEFGVFTSFFDGKLRFQFDYTMLDLENPFIFPNRPGFRRVTTVDLDFNWLVVSYDFYKEGEQFVMGSSFGRLFAPREDANLNVTLQKEIRGVNFSFSYTIRNLMSKGDSGMDSEFDILFFNYYNQYREIATLRVSL